MTNDYTVCIPTGRNNASIAPALLSAAQQDIAPVQILLGDQSATKDRFVSSLCRSLDVRMLEMPRDGRAANRKRLAEAALTDWLLFLDDDMSIWPQTFEQLARRQQYWDAVAVQPQIRHICPEMLASQGGTQGWARDVRTAWLDTGCLLVRREDWLSVHHPNIEWGEDLIATAQLGERGPLMVAHALQALHLRATPQGNLRLGQNDLEIHLKPYVSDKTYRLFATHYKPLPIGGGFQEA
jgi:GT2 family glycosyltransferase